MKPSNDSLLKRLGMSGEDAGFIEELCEHKNITAWQLLHQFLCDLADNRDSGGSDERMAAREWYNRSGF